MFCEISRISPFNLIDLLSSFLFNVKFNQQPMGFDALGG